MYLQGFVIRVNAMIPRISSMIAAPRMALPALVESLPSSFRVSTVIETDVAVSTTPMKRCCRNGEQASLSPFAYAHCSGKSKSAEQWYDNTKKSDYE